MSAMGSACRRICMGRTRGGCGWCVLRLHCRRPGRPRATKPTMRATSAGRVPMRDVRLSLAQAEALAELNATRPVKVIAVTGGKGGVGKTTVSANLAVAIAAQGRDVMLLDADLGLANV